MLGYVLDIEVPRQECAHQGEDGDSYRERCQVGAVPGAGNQFREASPDAED